MATLNGQKVNNARYVDQNLIQLYKDAGVIEKNMSAGAGVGTKKLKRNIMKLLRVNDEQCALRSIDWFNLPITIDADLIERILYYRGAGALFYLNDKWTFLPFTGGSKGIDYLGRWINITPLPFNGSVTSDKDEEDLKPLIDGLEFDVLYDLPDLNEVIPEDEIDSYIDDLFHTKAIILTDYCKQYSQYIQPRQTMQEGLIDLESDLLPFCRTALLNSTGVTGMRVNSADEQANVKIASRAINNAALEGEKLIAIEGTLDFQELTGDKVATADQFLMTMQSIDNYRLSQHGVDSGGIFQKQAHMLQSENEMNSMKASYSLKDRVTQRQHFCDLANAWFQLGIWADASEMARGVDDEGDGYYDDFSAYEDDNYSDDSGEEMTTDGNSDV